MMKIFLHPETLTAIKNQHIFIDTCILLDLVSLNKEDRKEFVDNLILFTKQGCSFVTIEPVVIEFFLGSSIQDLEIKRKFVNQIIETVIPARLINQEIIEELIIGYGRYARRNVSYTDLLLGAATKRFPNSVVLTRNYKDFPINIFECRAVFSVHLNEELRAYCFYQYPKNKLQEKRRNNSNLVPF